MNAILKADLRVFRESLLFLEKDVKKGENETLCATVSYLPSAATHFEFSNANKPAEVFIFILQLRHVPVLSQQTGLFPVLSSKRSFAFSTQQVTLTNRDKT